MGMMDDIEKLAQKARDLAEEHPDQVRKVLDQAEDQLDRRTGGKHAGQIDSAGDKIADFLAPDKAEGTG
jgi:MT0933-like antitoxin protein